MRADWPLVGHEILFGPIARGVSELIEAAMVSWRQKLGVDGRISCILPSWFSKCVGEQSKTRILPQRRSHTHPHPPAATGKTTGIAVDTMTSVCRFRGLELNASLLA